MNYLDKNGVQYLWNKIKSYVDSKVISSGGGITYSTNEQFTGDYWTDGKKIYQKSFYVNTTSLNIDINHGISNIGTYRVFDMNGSYWYNRSTYQSYPLSVYVNSNSWSSPYSITNTQIQMRFSANFLSTWGLWVTIRYTKNE